MKGINYKTGYSLLFMEYDVNCKPVKLLGQFPLHENSDHKERLEIGRKNGIKKFSFYILFNPKWVDNPKCLECDGMDKGGYTWFNFDLRTFKLKSVCPVGMS